MSKISVLGSGGWGIALALQAHSNGHEVVLWSPFKDEVDQINKDKENKKLLPGIKIPEDVLVTDSLSAISGSMITIIAVPSFAVRQTAERLRDVDCGIVVNVAKGFEKAPQNDCQR